MGLECPAAMLVPTLTLLTGRQATCIFKCFCSCGRVCHSACATARMPHERALARCARCACARVRVESRVGLCLGRPLESGRRLCRTCWRWLWVATIQAGHACAARCQNRSNVGCCLFVPFVAQAYTGACGASCLKVASLPQHHGSLMLPAQVGRLYMVAGCRWCELASAW